LNALSDRIFPAISHCQRDGNQIQNKAEQREEAVFEAALELPADQRAAYLDKTCAGDADLRRRVQVLLGAFERAGGFMKHPAFPASGGTVPFRPLPITGWLTALTGRLANGSSKTPMFFTFPATILKTSNVYKGFTGRMLETPNLYAAPHGFTGKNPWKGVFPLFLSSSSS